MHHVMYVLALLLHAIVNFLDCTLCNSVHVMMFILSCSCRISLSYCFHIISLLWTNSVFLPGYLFCLCILLLLSLLSLSLAIINHVRPFGFYSMTACACCRHAVWYKFLFFILVILLPLTCFLTFLLLTSKI